MRIRLSGQGEVGPGGGPAGDLYIEVTEIPDDVFTRAPDALWRTVLRRQGGDLAIAANFPLDPSAN